MVAGWRVRARPSAVAGAAALLLFLTAGCTGASRPAMIPIPASPVTEERASWESNRSLPDNWTFDWQAWTSFRVDWPTLPDQPAAQVDVVFPANVSYMRGSVRVYWDAPMPAWVGKVDVIGHHVVDETSLVGNWDDGWNLFHVYVGTHFGMWGNRTVVTWEGESSVRSPERTLFVRTNHFGDLHAEIAIDVSGPGAPE